MNEIIASKGKWLYNGSSFAKRIMTSGNTSQWYEVTDEYKQQVESIIVIGLQEAQENKILEIKEYDNSTSVNSFIYNNLSMWIDRDTRVSVLSTVKIEAEAGLETTTLWAGDIAITLSPQLIIQLLSSIEIYAHECYNVTQQHIANVKALTSLEDVENYDYTLGYPQQLVFNTANED